MDVYTYTTKGNKDLIYGYINNLSIDGQAVGLDIIAKIERDGLGALEILNTRQLKSKLWEIKFSQNRLMYVIADENTMYILHACKKQKGKAEQFELNKAISRAKELGGDLNKNFV
ncbi:type II toxin-antitoxin system RelE/ParE family toxin [Clostridium estertheticum]|uniref:Type II toxin-antitoxin system RelE/ParE family toxin n=1 Tax=Clostridium estertheticum TaxID=238834 RepID=A0A7Y3T0R6_9CLOT|nr:type II toxin-antitoxin system RelE/ParE family toxin [Clostridium estertheticum]NNU78595.1 type II toxin-antitoxin system RelE/ParE family toxin [Clostridium estertheticum]WBL49685.1 type II toxin-antitoxin system RelE/ParE family toxin [Clostridium estertheticum]